MVKVVKANARTWVVKINAKIKDRARPQPVMLARKSLLTSLAVMKPKDKAKDRCHKAKAKDRCNKAKDRKSKPGPQPRPVWSKQRLIKAKRLRAKAKARGQG